ncbi:GIN domain-containing protein [Pedobacter sp. NJ-S-72]
MKNSLKTLVASAMTAIVLSATVFSSIAAETIVPTEKRPAKADIKKVVVLGNTQVLLVQSNNDRVSIEEGRMDKVSVEQMGDVLTVSSKEDVPVTVTIYVKNLYRISALNNADVRTAGKFSLPYLQVILRDHAAAHINAKTESIYTDMDGGQIWI